jgi:two-component sensor histidine kinase
VEAYQRDAFARREIEHRCEFRILRPDGSLRWLEARSRAFYGSDGEPLRVVGVNVDITERKENEQRQTLLLREFDHRVKNILANVKALLLQTRLTGDPDDDFLGAFEGRLDTFARTHEALLGTDFSSAPLRVLAEQELSPYLRQGERNVALEGPDLSLSLAAAQMISLALHELATNAAKHGALSAPGGRILLAWRLLGGGEEGRVRLNWRETDGPPVEPPRRRGFGRMLLERSVASGLGGEARLSFAPEGACYELEFPAARNLAGRIAA